MNQTDTYSDETSRKMIGSIIQNLCPIDEIETLHQREALSWIDSNSLLFRLKKPNIPEKHLVSYCVVIDNEHKKILLVDHKKAERWLPPGGHVEPGETPFMTAQRELYEELGLHLEPMQSAPLFLSITETTGLTIKHTDVTLWYVFYFDSNTPIVFDTEEFHSIRWFFLDELSQIKSDPHIERFKIKFLKSTN